jgi:hypothetical protein
MALTLLSAPSYRVADLAAVAVGNTQSMRPLRVLATTLSFVLHRVNTPFGMAPSCGAAAAAAAEQPVRCVVPCAMCCAARGCTQTNRSQSNVHNVMQAGYVPCRTAVPITGDSHNIDDGAPAGECIAVHAADEALRCRLEQLLRALQCTRHFIACACR